MAVLAAWLIRLLGWGFCRARLYYRAASHIDGTASVLVGVAANQAMQTKRLICIDELFPLYSMMRFSSDINQEPLDWTTGPHRPDSKQDTSEQSKTVHT
jgi:hypothetical protein